MGFGGPCCSFIMLLMLCFGNGATETRAKSPWTLREPRKALSQPMWICW